MTLKNAAAEIGGFLTGKSAGGVALVLGANLFVGKVRTIDQTPAPAVFLLNTGGPTPEAYYGGHRSALYRPTVQVFVRGPADDDQAGEALALAVLEWLHMQVISGWISWNVRESAPTFLGTDRDQHGQWSINVEGLYRASLA